MNMTSDASASRHVGIPLGIGIALLPLVFSWLTLRSGHSTKARAISFAWLIFSIVLFAATPSDQVTSTPQSEVAEATSVEHSIIKDDYLGPIKRTVEVQLEEPITEGQLRTIAGQIKAKATHKTERTFIGYRLRGKESGMYWATTNYNPDLQVSILGLTREGYRKLSDIDVAERYPNAVGAWLRDDYGSLSHLMIAYERDGSFFIDLLFGDGDKTTQEFLGERRPDGTFYFKDPENEYGEYFIMDARGALQGWNSGGLYVTVPAFQEPR